MKKWISAYVAVFMAVIVVLSAAFGISGADEADFSIVSKNGEYLSQIATKNGKSFILYRNGEQGKIQIENSYKDLKGYKTEGTVASNGAYYIFSFTENGKQLFGIDKAGNTDKESIIPTFEAEGTFFAAGSTEREILVSILGDDGRLITEYMLPLNIEGPVWEERVSFSITDDHFALCGSYDSDELIFLREDGKVFRRDVIVREVEESLEETVLADCFDKDVMDGAESKWKLNVIVNSVKGCVIPSLVIAAFIVLILYARRARSHMVFRLICAVEIVCMVVLSAAGYMFSNKITEQKVLEAGIEAGYALEEIRLEQRADGTINTEVYWEETQKRSGLIDDLIIAEPYTGSVIMSKAIPEGMDIVSMYGTGASALAAKVANGKEAAMAKLDMAGYNRYAVALRDWKEMDSKAIFIAILSETGIELKAGEAAADVWKTFSALMAVITIANIIIYIFFAGRWKHLAESMAYMATEKKAVNGMPNVRDGLQDAWVSLDRIGHNTNKLHYERDMLYRSYYRFVPKGMETLLKKDKAADIEIGDRNKIRGCMVNFVLGDMKCIDGSEYNQIMTESLEAMHMARENHDGIFIGAGTDLRERKIFFENNAREALKFAVDLLHTQAERSMLVENDLIMMLYESNFDYGVSGVKEMMTPFMYCPQERVLEPYINLLLKAKVRIALTEETLRLIGDGFTTRFIGFVSGGENEGSLKLYECLDAYKESKRKLMLETDMNFQKAIQLFYSNDFYLARNMFNEVLKLNDKDHIARWYLFHCEYHLNNPETEVSYGLFESTVMEQGYDKL